MTTLMTEEQEEMACTFMENIFEYGNDSILTMPDIERNDNQRLMIFESYCTLKAIQGTPAMDYIEETLALDSMQSTYDEHGVSIETVNNIMREGEEIQRRLNIPDMQPGEALDYMFDQRNNGSK